MPNVQQRPHLVVVVLVVRVRDAAEEEHGFDIGDLFRLAFVDPAAGMPDPLRRLHAVGVELESVRDLFSSRRPGVAPVERPPVLPLLRPVAAGHLLDRGGVHVAGPEDEELLGRGGDDDEGSDGNDPTATTAATVSQPAATATSSRPAELKDVTLGYSPILIYAPVYVALEKGYFADEGINLKLERISELGPDETTNTPAPSPATSPAASPSPAPNQ